MAEVGDGGGGSFKCIVPVTIPGPAVLVPGPTNVFAGAIAKPVTALPGLTPRSAVAGGTPLTVVRPVFVTVVWPRTP
jgi:hypothetical protein